MATIRERRPGVWEVRGHTGRDREGNPTQVSRTVHGTKRDTQRVAAELTVKPARNAGGRKVGQLLDEWLEIKAPSWAPLTVRDQTSRSALIQSDPIASMSVASIGVSDIDRWVARLRRSGAGESSIRNRHTVLRAALQQAVRWERIATNPASAAPIEQPKRQQEGTLTNDEVRALIEAAAEVHEMARLVFRLAAETGARRGQLAAVRWGKFVDDRVVVDGQIIVSTTDGVRAPRLQPTKTGSRRVVTLSPSLVEMVAEKAAKYAALTDWLFTPDADPPNPDRIGWWWRRARELAAIDDRWRLHDLRHWSATQSIASGQDVRTVAHRLGHADPAMTLRVYAHAVDRADEALAQILGEALDSWSTSCARRPAVRVADLLRVQLTKAGTSRGRQWSQRISILEDSFAMSTERADDEPTNGVVEARAPRTKVRLTVAVATGTVAAFAGIVAVLASGDGVSGWDVMVISAIAIGFLLLLFEAYWDHVNEQATREVVLTLDATGTDRQYLEPWQDKAHTRVHVTVIARYAEVSIELAAHSIRFGQLLDPSVSPLLILRSETSIQLPKHEPDSYEVWAEPASSDWDGRVRHLSPSDDRHDDLFDAMNRITALNLDIKPEIIRLTRGVEDRLNEFRSQCDEPDHALATIIQNTHHSPVRGDLYRYSFADAEARSKKAPLLFNVLDRVGVSVTGSSPRSVELDGGFFDEEWSVYTTYDDHGMRSRTLFYATRVLLEA